MIRRLFIINPNAGRGRAQNCWNDLKNELNNRQIQFDSYFTKSSGEAITYLKKYGSQYDQVIAVGGDGTIHEVVNGIVNTDIRLGIIPAGTGNDFARMLNRERKTNNYVQAVDKIIQNESVEIDLIQILDRVFINVASIGFDATVTYNRNKSKMLKKIGSVGYMVSVFKTLPLYSPNHTRIEIDGSTYEFPKTWLIAIGNGTTYGGGMKILPKSDYRDGLLDICVVANVTKLGIACVFPRVFNGSHISLPAVQIFRGKQVRIKSSESLHIQTDGEMVLPEPTSQENKGNDVIINILPKAIKLLV